MARPIVYEVHDAVVASYLLPGGEVKKLIDDVAKGTADYSKGFIAAGHVRSGRLLRSVFWNQTKPEGPLRGVALAGASARHTLYFHDGTGPIVSNHMIVPHNRHAANTSTAFSGAGAEAYAGWKAEGGKKGGGKRPVSFQNSVSGQKAKPFLTVGLAVSLAKQRL